MENLTGYSNRIIEVRTEINDNDKIAFFYPGMRYGSDAPLFYFITRLLLSQNIDICFFEFEWNNLPLAENVSKADKVEIIKSEISSSIEYIKQQDSNKQKFLFSKSVGSLVAETFTEEFLNTFEKKFYFTPFIDVEKCIGQNSFYDY